MNDERIIGLFFERSEQAISELEKKYGKLLYAVSNNVLNDSEDARECVNDTYLATWNAIPPQRPYMLKAFLASIMRNHALMIERRQKAQKRAAMSQAVSLSELEDVLADVRETDDAHMLAMVIESYIASLDKDQRYIFLGRYYFGKSIDDIASEMGVSRSKVSKQIAYIKQALRKKLAEEGIGV